MSYDETTEPGNSGGPWDPDENTEPSLRPRQDRLRRSRLKTALLIGIPLLAGALVGTVGGWTLKPDVIREVVVPGKPAPPPPGLQEELEEANARVDVLEEEVEERAVRVQELEAQLAQPNDKVQELEAALKVAKVDLHRARKELDGAVQELEEAEGRLTAAEQANVEVTAELVKAQGELSDVKGALSDQRTEKRRIADELARSQWRQFVVASQLRICDRGSKIQVQECRTAVEAALRTTSRRNRFLGCLQNREERTNVQPIGPDGVVPDFAEVVDPNDKRLNGWFIAFCDRTLPNPSFDPGPDDAPPEGEASRDSVLLSSQGLQAVRIATSPPGATIIVDGTERGKTPVKLMLSPESHRIALKLDGASARFTLFPREEQALCFTKVDDRLTKSGCDSTPRR
ncbi:MAG: PEGA domain-containing protein [Myxococcota bacterium]